MRSVKYEHDFITDESSPQRQKYHRSEAIKIQRINANTASRMSLTFLNGSPVYPFYYPIYKQKQYKASCLAKPKVIMLLPKRNMELGVISYFC